MILIAAITLLGISWLFGSLILSVIWRRKNDSCGHRFQRAFASLCIGACSLCGVIAAFCYVYNYWRVYSIFNENFAMPFSSVSHFKGDEGNWISYYAWVSFTYNGSPILRHPQDYQQVPCTTNSISDASNNPFITPDNNYVHNLLAMLPTLECKEGKINGWISPYGQHYFDKAGLVYNPQTHQIFFTIEE